MKTICLYFEIHQPFRLRNFPFFEIGNGKDYFDEELNSSILNVEVDACYLPLNKLLLRLILEHEKKINISFCISGTALEQFEKYTPGVIGSFQELFDTGCVEFVGDTFAHSLAALKSRGEFACQAKAHSEKINKLFGARPKAFPISQLGYTDTIGEILNDIGFDTVILKGDDKSGKNRCNTPVYRSALIPGLKLLVNSQQLEDEINLRSSEATLQEFPFAADKYIDWLMKVPGEEYLINLTLSYGSLANLQQNGKDIFEFIDRFIKKSLSYGIQLYKPSLLEDWASDAPLFASSTLFEAIKNSRNELINHVGNDMQQEAFNALYGLEKLIVASPDSSMKRDWLYLQSSDHFYYMGTDHIAPDGRSPYLSPYETPFFAFINFMNVLSDLDKRVKSLIENPADELVTI